MRHEGIEDNCALNANMYKFLTRNMKYYNILKFQVTAETETCVMNKIKNMKNGAFWNVTPCGSCKNRRFGENLAPPSSG
jgi:hypothetical protein